MNWPSARSIRASPFFSTTKREPESFAAVSKSIWPSASPSSKCSFAQFTRRGSPHFRTSTLAVSSGPTGTSSSGTFGMIASASSSAFVRRPLLLLGRLHRVLQRRDLGHQRLRPRLVLLRLRLPDLLRGGVAARLHLLQLRDRRPPRLVERDQPSPTPARPRGSSARGRAPPGSRGSI